MLLFIFDGEFIVVAILVVGVEFVVVVGPYREPVNSEFGVDP